MKNRLHKEIYLEESVELTVLFNEVDSMNVVWHGHYYKYFEAARSKFCQKYKIDMQDFINHKIIAPVSRTDCKYKSPLFYQDKITVKVICYHHEEPKLVFDYKIFNQKGLLTTVGRTEQLFLDENFQLLFEQPPLINDFFKLMKERCQ